MFGPETPAARVYASFRYRRDFADAIVPASWPALVEQVPWDKALQIEPTSGFTATAAEADPADMRQAVAWQLAQTALREWQARVGADDLQRRLAPGARVHHVRAVLSFSSRHAELVHLPAYVLDYTWGETFNVSGERVPEHFLATVGGSGGAPVAGQRQYSRAKAGAAAAAACALVGTAASGSTFLWPLNVEAAFTCTIAALCAGLATKFLPALSAQHEEQRRVAREEAELDLALEYGIGAAALGSEEQEELLAAAEWRRWSCASLRTWDADKRRGWAEDLLVAQLRRRRERLERATRVAEESARRDADEAREARRRARYGTSAHHHHFRNQQSQFAGGTRSGGRVDFLGLYAALDLDRATGPIADADIKRAYRRQALQWHPDRHRHSHKAVIKARERFHKVQEAYEVLKDPQKRARYEAGQNPDREL